MPTRTLRGTLLSLLRRRDRSDGAAAVEAALVISFVVLPLVFAIIAYAYMLSFRQSLTQAVADGARTAAVAPAWSGDQVSTNTAAVEDAINRALSAGVQCNGATMMRGGNVVGSCEVGPPHTKDGSSFVTVDLKYDYGANPLLPLPLLGFVMPSTIKHSATVEVN